MAIIVNSGAGGGSATGCIIKYLGIGNTIDVSEMCEDLGIEKSELTVNDFIVEPQDATKTSSATGKVNAGGYDEVDVASYSKSAYTLTKSYDPTTGIFTCSSVTMSGSRKSGSRKGGGADAVANANSSCKVYLYKKEVD